MGARCVFRPVEESDILYIAQNMRAADLGELRASHGDECDVLALLRRSVGQSSLAVTTVDACTGEPVAIFGAGPLSLLSDIGVPWMLGTERMFDFPRELLADGRRWVGAMLQDFSELANYVDVRNDLSVRWLKRLGFSFSEPVPYGIKGMSFYRFEKKAQRIS